MNLSLVSLQLGFSTPQGYFLTQHSNRK